MSELIEVELDIKGKPSSETAFRNFMDYLYLEMEDDIDKDIKSEIKFLLQKEKQEGQAAYSTIKDFVYLDEKRAKNTSKDGNTTYFIMIDPEKLLKTTKKELIDTIKRKLYLHLKVSNQLKEDNVNIEELCKFMAQNIFEVTDLVEFTSDIDLEFLQALMYDYTNSFSYSYIPELDKALTALTAKSYLI